MDFKILVASILPILSASAIAGIQLNIASAQSEQEQNLLEVKFANSVGESYSVMVNSDEKYTISQSYSWIRNEYSRYNLVSYSLDNGSPTEIPRKARGSFTLDVPMDSDHTVTFFAVIQYPISITIDGSNDAENIIRFDPPSQTGDNWFDTSTSVAIAVPIYMVQQEQHRKQLVSWTIDSSNLREITLSNSQPAEFSTPPTIIASQHVFAFFTKDQYYLQVVSEHGTVTGHGWHDFGSEATVSVKPTNQFPIDYISDGSEGIQWTETDGYFTTVLMDSPKTLVVKWKADYNQLFMVGATAAFAFGLAAVMQRKKARRKELLPQQTALADANARLAARTITTATTSSVSTLMRTQKQDQEESSNRLDTRPDNHQRKLDEYAREIMDFALTKSLETLESLHSSGLVPDSRIATTKQKLEQTFS